MQHNTRREQGKSMSEAVRILLAMQERKRLHRLIMDMGSEESCFFDGVTSGWQAIDACIRSTPHILVIDAVLAQIDGLGVMDRLKDELGAHMPHVIGVAGTPFSREGFLRRGAKAVVPAPCDTETLKAAILQVIAQMQTQLDWAALYPMYHRAGELLNQMGMPDSLKGYEYLSWAAALAYEHEARLSCVGREIYEPIAVHCATTKGNVERLIRHAIESTMSAARARGVYTLFGNTIDPAKGKPTNAHVIALLAQRMRVTKNEAV